MNKKYKTVIQKNTFYFFNPKFEEEYEGYISSLKETLLNLKNKIENKGLKKEFFVSLIRNKENGLDALLTLTGFSFENLKRIITIIRICDEEELNELVYKDKWVNKSEDENFDIKEWGKKKIVKLIKNNKYFAKGIINLFFEGASVKFLSETLPLFELKKLSISKLKFEPNALIDTLVRYKVKRD